MNWRLLIGAIALPLVLSACGAGGRFSESAVPRGPAPKILNLSADGPDELVGPLTCVAKKLPPQARDDSIGVLDFIDKTGSMNQVGNDSFGFFNTQGAADMLTTALVDTGLPVIELGPSYRAIVDWGADKTDASGRLRTRQANTTVANGRVVNNMLVSTPVGYVSLPKYGLVGAITSTDFMPGDGVNVGAFGAGINVERNWAFSSMDIRLVELPHDGKPGGRILHAVSVAKQVHQSSLRVGLTRVLSSIPATIFSFDVGGGKREPMKFAARAMLGVGLIGILSQRYNVDFKDCFQ